jgi:hypothetical protein
LMQEIHDRLLFRSKLFGVHDTHLSGMSLDM